MTFSGTSPGVSSHLEQADGASQPQNTLQHQLNAANNLQENLTPSNVSSIALWGAADQPVRMSTVGDVSSGSSGYQSGVNMAGKKHLWLW